jgi:hypothetical protein
MRYSARYNCTHARLREVRICRKVLSGTISTVLPASPQVCREIRFVPKPSFRKHHRYGCGSPRASTPILRRASSQGNRALRGKPVIVARDGGGSRSTGRSSGSL